MAATLEPPEAQHHNDAHAHVPAASEPPRPTFWSRILNNRFLFISIVAHLLFGLAAAAWVVQTITAKRKLTFTAAPPSPNPSTRALEHKVTMARKQNTMSAPVQSKRITTTGLSKVALPEMPAMPAMNTAMSAPGRMAGMGGTGAGLGPSTGAMGGSGSGLGGGPVPFFGLRASGNGLAGTFYDLKQEKDGKPTDMVAPPGEKSGWEGRNEPTNRHYDETLSRVVRNGMSEGSLAKYFRGPVPLYINQFYIPRIFADDGPKAFNLGDKVQPKRWVILYRGRVIPPESGNYRFVGSGDDILVVRFNNRTVLDGSYFRPTGEAPKKTYQLDGLRGGFPVGDTFEVRAGTPYNMEVLIGERPGGHFLVFLLLEKAGDKEEAGPRKLPLFKLAPSNMPKGGEGLPALAADQPWSVWRSQPLQPRFGGF